MHGFSNTPQSSVVGDARSTASASVAPRGTASATSGPKPVVEEYAWEKAYDYTWEAVEEDASGMLRTHALERSRMQRSTAASALSRVQRGMLRHVYVVLDLSRAMALADDFKPTRAAAVIDALKEFVLEYFDANPISSLGVIVVRNGVAERCSDMSTNARRHVEALDALLSTPRSGDFSLQNALDVAVQRLSLVPVYGSREVVVVHGAHNSVDAGNVMTTMAACVSNKVRVSVIGLPGEVYIAARVARETGGTYSVPESRDGLRVALMAQCPPPPRTAAQALDAASMVAMGFPQLQWESPALCACHGELKARGYACPRCRARMCEASTCLVCGLQLVSAAALARSYHHLFPVTAFLAVADAASPVLVPAALRDGEDRARRKADGVGDGRQPPEVEEYVTAPDTHCAACLATLAASTPRYVCLKCTSAFCVACDVLIHDTLHNCPTCV